MEIIKLKDCSLVNIDSDIRVDKARYYYETDDIIQEIGFIFDDGTDVTCSFSETYNCFGIVLGFFYSRDFSNMTKEEFLKTFIRETLCDCSLYDYNEWKRIVDGDRDE